MPSRTLETFKNRLTPIQLSVERIRGYPSTLIIYKTTVSKNYWVRFSFKGKKRIKTIKCALQRY